jgi:hypothetical protein
LKDDVAFGLSDPKSIYYSLLYQMTHITTERGALVHDDRLDVLALGVQFWNDYGILKQNSDDALNIYKKKQIEDELKRRANVFRSMNMKKSKSKPSLQRLL